MDKEKIVEAAVAAAKAANAKVSVYRTKSDAITAIQKFEPASEPVIIIVD